MATVFIQVGQCGNQVGQEFWKRIIANDLGTNKCGCFWNHDGKFRSVNVDSEPKVIYKLRRTAGFRESNVICGRRGRGSNWALGYNGVSNENILKEVLEQTRKEIERCDHYCGSVMFHSLGGGTGSGLGSHLVESLRDEYPLHHLLSCAIVPSSSGDSPLQHYNSLLTIAALQRHTDGIILLHNDDVLESVQKQKKRDASVSFNDINQELSAILCGQLLPTDSLSTTSSVSIGLEPWELIRSVCPMPGLKFLHSYHAAKSKVKWDVLASHVIQGFRRYDSHEQLNRTISALTVARGDSANMFSPSLKTLDSKLKAALACVTWNPFPIDYWTAKKSMYGNQGLSSLTTTINSSRVADYLENLVKQARMKYEAGAFLHWYWRHGASKEDFEEAFNDVSTIIDNYKDAVR